MAYLGKNLKYQERKDAMSVITRVNMGTAAVYVEGVDDVMVAGAVIRGSDLFNRSILVANGLHRRLEKRLLGRRKEERAAVQVMGEEFDHYDAA
jgi:hypothetical protein